MIDTSSKFSTNSSRMESSLASSSLHNSDRFKKLIEHLPEMMKIDIFNYSIAENVLDEQLKETRSFSILKNKSPYEVSKMAILAYRIGKISFEEMNTIFMHIGALEELYLNQKMFLSTIGKNTTPRTFSCYINEMDRSFSPFIPNGFLRTEFRTSQRMELEKQGLSNEYIKQLEDQNKLDIPFIKKFFHFNESEWKTFNEKMLSASENEKWFTFLKVPEFGCWSFLYEHLTKIIHCFQITKYLQRTDSLDSPPVKIKYLLLPSFTMMETALQIKALMHNRKALELSPHFGALSYDDVLPLRKKDQAPFGLYCPTSLGLDPEITIKHMRTVDGHHCSGPLSFMYHDLYHALRWQEMNEMTAKAILYVVEVLDSYSRSLAKKSDKYKELRTLRNRLIDGELIFSYSKENSLFKNRPFSPQKFGDIFDEQWPMDLKDRILLDLAKKLQFWDQKFNITPLDLKPEEGEMVHLMDLLFVDSAPSSIFDVTLKDENNPLKKLKEVKNVKIINSYIGHISCEKTLICNSKIASIQATHRAVFWNSHVKSIKIDTPTAIFVNIGKAKSIIGTNQLMFKLTASKNCSKIKAPRISWNIDNESQLIFDEFECDELTIEGEGKWENNLNLTFKDCKIAKIFFYKQFEEEAQNFILNFSAKFMNSLSSAFFILSPSKNDQTQWIIRELIVQ